MFYVFRHLKKSFSGLIQLKILHENLWFYYASLRLLSFRSKSFLLAVAQLSNPKLSLIFISPYRKTISKTERKKPIVPNYRSLNFDLFSNNCQFYFLLALIQNLLFSYWETELRRTTKSNKISWHCKMFLFVKQ